MGYAGRRSAVTTPDQSPRQVIQVGGQQLRLPEGVSAAQWGLERVRWQNPRIRSLLGGINLLEGVLESNYAILHCSPERLHEIWRQVRRVAEVIGGELAGFLRAPSCIPRLEEARRDTLQSLGLLERTVLRDLERFPAELPGDRMIEARKLLCVSMGKLHAFLQDTFSHLVAADPRSVHDADYFLSRRFSRDIEEAEWLHASVAQLSEYLDSLEAGRYRRLTRAIESLETQRTLPPRLVWEELRGFLDKLVEELTPRLTEILALRGIRFYEMEVLDAYSVRVPTACRLVLELGEAGRLAGQRVRDLPAEWAGDRHQTVRALIELHAVFTARMARLLRDLDGTLRDLRAFVPLWLESIGRRRALLLRQGQDYLQVAPEPAGEAADEAGAAEGTGEAGEAPA